MFALIPLGIYLVISKPINYLLFFDVLGILFLRYVLKKRGIRLKEWNYSFILAAIYLAVLGDNFLNLYYIFPYYDKFGHFIIPLGLTYILLDSGIIKEWYLSLFSVLGLSAIFELIEFYIDTFFGTVLQGVFSLDLQLIYQQPLADTMYDMTCAFFGSILGIAIYLCIVAKKKYNKNPVKV